MIENQWTEFAAALIGDPDARIDFAPVDEARAAERWKRKNPRLVGAELTARMIAEADLRRRAHPNSPGSISLAKN